MRIPQAIEGIGKNVNRIAWSFGVRSTRIGYRSERSCFSVRGFATYAIRFRQSFIQSVCGTFGLVHDCRIENRRDAELVIKADISFLRLEIKCFIQFVIFEQISKSPVRTVSSTAGRKFSAVDSDETMERSNAPVRINHGNAIVIEHRHEHLADKVLFVQIAVRLHIEHGIRLYLHFLEIVKDNLSAIEIFIRIAVPRRIDKKANRAMDFPLDLREKPCPKALRVRFQIAVRQVIGKFVFVKVKADKQMVADTGWRMRVDANFGTIHAFNQQKTFFQESSFRFTRIPDIRLKNANQYARFRLFTCRHLLNNQVAPALAEMDDILQTSLDAFLEQVLQSISREHVNAAVPPHRSITGTHDDSKRKVVVFFLIMRNTGQHFNNGINDSLLHFRKLS